MVEVRQAVRGVLRRVGRSRVVAPAPPSDPYVVGMVEEFSRRLIAGWVSVQPATEPLRVDFFVNNVRVSSTYATSSESMSGLAINRDEARATRAAPTPELTSHPWQAQEIPSPSGDRRNSRGQVRTFAFRVRGIWQYTNRESRLTVRINGKPLPIYGHGMFLTPPRRGKKSVAALKRRLAEGYVLGQGGVLQLSKQLDVDWQCQVMHLYGRTRKIVRESHGYEVFFLYGTLLGAVRDGGYIGHDGDFDSGYISRYTSGREAAAELEDIAMALLAEGLGVELRYRVLHIHDPESECRIDLFHTWFDDHDKLRFPWGVAGATTYRREQWRGTREIDFPGGRGLIPVDAETLVEHIYGEDWRRPKPGFQWALERTDVADEGRLTTEQRTRVYWANFYAHTQYTSGSAFFEFVNERAETPGRILDIGCGDGRDACAFGAAGRTVLGVDQASVGLEHAERHAGNLGVADRVRFRVADVAVEHDLRRLVEGYLDESDEPTMFYLRFFLHAIPEDVQETVLQVIADCARPGDTFAAEFRTDRDESRRHVHAKHFRRFQSAGEFRDALAGKYGFEVFYDVEGTGLSPYQDEDPVLYRVLARRPTV